MRNEELWYRLSAINFLIGANAVRLLLVCKACVIHNTIFAFFKPCRGATLSLLTPHSSLKPLLT